MQAHPLHGTPDETSHTSSVLIVEDHPDVLRILADIVSLEPDLKVCATAQSVPEAQAALASRVPDLAVVDLKLKDTMAFDLLREIREKYPSVRVAVLTMHTAACHAERAFDQGALAFITKQESPEEVMHAIRMVMRGERYVSRQVAVRMASSGSLPADLSLRDNDEEKTA